MSKSEQFGEATARGEDALWRAAKAGRREAIGELFELHRPLALFHVRRALDTWGDLRRRDRDEYVATAYEGLYLVIRIWSDEKNRRGWAFSTIAGKVIRRLMTQRQRELTGLRPGKNGMIGIRACSLDAERTGPDGRIFTLAERVSDPFGRDGAAESEDTDSRAKLKAVVLGLPEQERRLVVLRFWHGWSMERIGERLGVVRQWCHELLKKAIERLRRRLLQAFGGIPEIA